MTLADIDLAALPSIRDFEDLARARMSAQAWDYLAGGSWDEVTLRDNEAAFIRHRLMPRMLVDVSSVSIRTTVLGRDVAGPFGVAPMALQAMCHPDAESAVAAAASSAGAVFCLSTASSHSLEAVAKRAAPAGGGSRWFQLYVQPDRALSRTLVERAGAAGYEAIVVTVDLPAPGWRDRDLRWPEAIEARLGNFVARGRDLNDVFDTRHAAPTWADLDEIRSWSDLPLIIKGLLHPADATMAVEHGASAIVVSNHGGRQLDRVPASIDALAAIVDAVEGRAEVYVDGGVRRGTDVVTALALGARAVFIGRPMLWALAAAGERGVARALALLAAETERAMALLGVASVAAIDRSHVQAIGQARPTS